MIRNPKRLLACAAFGFVMAASLVALGPTSGATLNIPLPSNAMLGASAPSVQAETCVSATATCYAVGSYESDIATLAVSEYVGAPVVGVPEGFIATSTNNGSTWTSESAPTSWRCRSSAGWKRRREPDVHCDGGMLRVGGYDSSGGVGKAVIETLNSGSWSPTEVTLPYPSSPANFYTGSGMGCASATSCVTYGELVFASSIVNGTIVDSGLDPVIIGLWNGTWTAIAAPTPSDGQIADGFTVGALVSADLGSPYVVYGYYTTTAGVAESYTDTGEPGNTWTASSTSAPAPLVENVLPARGVLSSTGNLPRADTAGLRASSVVVPHVGDVQPSHGYSGMVVDINGSGFAVGDTVFFGDRPARIAFIASPESIVVYAPGGHIGSRVRVRVKGTSGGSGLTIHLHISTGSSEKSPPAAGPSVAATPRSRLDARRWASVTPTPIWSSAIASLLIVTSPFGPTTSLASRLRYTSYGKTLASTAEGRAAIRRDGQIEIVAVT